MKILTEAKIDEYNELFVNKRKEVTQKEFDKLKSFDEAPFVYLPWLVKQYLLNRSNENIFKLLSKYIGLFKEFKQNLTNKDINSYSLVDLISTVENEDLLTKKIKKDSGLDFNAGAKKVIEEDNKSLYLILGKMGAQKYGKGTKWCIAAQEGNYWDNYTSSLFYFFIDKNLKEYNPITQKGDKQAKIAIQVRIEKKNRKKIRSF